MADYSRDEDYYTPSTSINRSPRRFWPTRRSSDEMSIGERYTSHAGGGGGGVETQVDQVKSPVKSKSPQVEVVTLLEEKQKSLGEKYQSLQEKEKGFSEAIRILRKEDVRSAEKIPSEVFEMLELKTVQYQKELELITVQLTEYATAITLLSSTKL